MSAMLATTGWGMSQTLAGIFWELVATYGTQFVGLIMAGLIGLLGTRLTKHVWLRDFFLRAAAEAKDVVMEVAQTYADGIRAGRQDGVLTDAEKATARSMALAKLKANLGPKLLERARRVLGADDAGIDRLLETKVEAQVQRLNLIKSGALAPLSVDGSTTPPARPPSTPPPPPPPPPPSGTSER